MRIILVQTIPHDEQRYPTVGDYFKVQDITHFSISDLGNRRAEAAIFIHEFVEAMLCEEQGVSFEAIDKFDLNWKGSGEPGDDPDAPYFAQHQCASVIERQFCKMIGLAWEEYTRIVNEV